MSSNKCLQSGSPAALLARGRGEDGGPAVGRRQPAHTWVWRGPAPGAQSLASVMMYHTSGLPGPSAARRRNGGAASPHHPRRSSDDAGAEPNRRGKLEAVGPEHARQALGSPLPSPLVDLSSQAMADRPKQITTKDEERPGWVYLPPLSLGRDRPGRDQSRNFTQLTLDTPSKCAVQDCSCPFLKSPSPPVGPPTAPSQAVRPRGTAACRRWAAAPCCHGHRPGPAGRLCLAAVRRLPALLLDARAPPGQQQQEAAGGAGGAVPCQAQ